MCSVFSFHSHDIHAQLQQKRKLVDDVQATISPFFVDALCRISKTSSTGAPQLTICKHSESEHPDAWLLL